MQLVSLNLNNIRSYTNSKLEFPTGIVMLSGDIGSGKSTILLAIEFALFGVMRGELSGNALLRNGAQQGSVELAFKIGNDNYLIKRTLVRTKKSVEQDAGYLLVNGVKKDATAIELKSAILELIGYPQELLTKTKNFVYRYTVYTPQEEMKRILLEDKEERLAILRKVFGVDKYERITHNAGTYAKTLREKQRAFDALLADAEEKKKQAEEARKELADAQLKIKEVTPQLTTARTALEQAKTQVLTLEKQRTQAEILTRDLHVAKTQLLGKQQHHKQAQNDLSAISHQILEARKELPLPNGNDFSKKIQDSQKIILEKEQHIRQASMKIAEFGALKKQAGDLANKVSTIDQCPTCLQKVTAEHKHSIISVQQTHIQTIDKQITEHSTLSQQKEQELAQLKKELEQLRQKEKEAAVASVKIKYVEQLGQRKTGLEQQQAALVQDISITTTKIAQIEQQLLPLTSVNAEYELLRNQLEDKQAQERQLSINHSTLLQKEQNSAKTLTILEQDLERKQKVRKQLEKAQHTHQWLTDYFVPLMGVMEQHVMRKIHHEFDTLFQQWFSMLIEDTMAARLDETFTPIIQQNGYDIEVENLSGGERTACALAYRLALNKTINSLISTVKTKDLLILDEPTDGFSAEQLDKMKDVLDQLNLKQIVIVSHEQKIEGMADRVIRVHKTDHTSSFLT